VFRDPDFLKEAKILAICVHVRQISNYLIFAWIFRTSWPKMGVLVGGAYAGGGGDWVSEHPSPEV